MDVSQFEVIDAYFNGNLEKFDIRQFGEDDHNDWVIVPENTFTSSGEGTKLTSNLRWSRNFKTKDTN